MLYWFGSIILIVAFVFLVSKKKILGDGEKVHDLTLDGPILTLTLVGLLFLFVAITKPKNIEAFGVKLQYLLASAEKLNKEQSELINLMKDYEYANIGRYENYLNLVKKSKSMKLSDDIKELCKSYLNKLKAKYTSYKTFELDTPKKQTNAYAIFPPWDNTLEENIQKLESEELPNVGREVYMSALNRRILKPNNDDSKKDYKLLFNYLKSSKSINAKVSITTILDHKFKNAQIDTLDFNGWLDFLSSEVKNLK